MYFVFLLSEIYIFLIWSIFRSFLDFFFRSVWWWIILNSNFICIFFSLFIGSFWRFIYSCIYFQIEKLIFQKRDSFLNSHEAELKKKAIYWFHWKNVQFVATSFAMNSLFCSKVCLYSALEFGMHVKSFN